MTTPNLDDMDPFSPEYEAEVERLQALEDEEREGSQQTTTTTEEDDTAGQQANEQQAGEQQADNASQQQNEPEKQPAPAGVVSKDGKTFLPWGVVVSEREAKKAERRAREAAEARASDLERQLSELRGGKAPAASERQGETGGDPLDQIIADAELDFPQLAVIAKELKVTREQLAATKTGGKATEDPAKPAARQELDPEEQLQSDIDAVPLLAAWQASDAEKFARAQAIDSALVDSPKWRGKPQVERFRHVMRMVADEFDIQVDEEEAPPQDTKPPASRANPRDIVRTAQRTPPSSLSEFKGGAHDKTDRIDALPINRMTARFEDMSDEQIEAHLAKYGG